MTVLFAATNVIRVLVRRAASWALKKSSQDFRLVAFLLEVINVLQPGLCPCVMDFFVSLTKQITKKAHLQCPNSISQAPG